MTITRRFRREFRQELSMGQRIKTLPLLLLIGSGVILAEATRAEGQAYWVRLLGFPAVLVLAYILGLLGSAQLRARAQPFDHTLVISEEVVTIVDNLRRQESQHMWEEFERVQITPQHFSIRLRKASRGESYLIDRRKLSPEEENFIGRQLIEL